ncbi:substrate-binding domain-containing protein [Pararhizobium sp. LjRoot235]|uniref:substrate-binding domain-containing protein n=1 Tax=Pararhizobium sp. LjRoot235 TaxID=3342291 RepID=UPI003ECE3145
MKQLLFTFVAMLTLTCQSEARTLGFSAGHLDTFNTGLMNGLISHAKSKAGIEILTEDAGGDTQLQIKQVEKLAAAKVDALIVMLDDGDLGAQMTKIAATAGIPLVFVNNIPANIEDLPDNQVVVASDERESGTLQTKEVCALLKGKGRVAVLVGEPAHAAARARTEDIDSVISTEPCTGIHVVERQSAYWSLSDADHQVQEWLSAGAQFDAVIANNDDMALGAVQALKRNGVKMTDVIVAGVDAIPDALKAVESGDMDVTVFQNAAAQGAGSVDAALSLIDGQKVSRMNFVPFELVTRQNVARYAAQNN